jgi:uncharacterized secreted protein with C-terminal beta-propeller domain
MQSEIRKRIRNYGIVAVLSALLLVVLVYSLGVYPQEFQPTSSFGLFKTFASNEELRGFLTTHSGTQAPFPFFSQWDFRNMGPLFDTYGESAQSLKLYSTTNIQVAGVDEADTVKTDGEYIYLVSGNSVYILKAYPAEEAEILSKIFINGTYPVGIFVNNDRLAVLGCKYFVPTSYYYNLYVIDIKTFVDIYDISNRADPVLLRNFTLSGSYFTSRMIGDYVYFVVSQPAYVIHDTVILPKVYLEDGMKEIPASDIYYASTSDDYYMYTTIGALNMQDVTEEPNYKTIMLGGTSTMYVSSDNIYITFHESSDETSIHRIRIENNTITPEAKGKVPGNVLNQFSMDENADYFRIATTTWVNGTTRNNLYILNMNLSIVGRLENLAPEEAIDSARFIGNRCYLATSVVRRDPFFVIDIENATEPKILGYLKIPGFTRYLHPYDENHIIGVGKDGNNSVKISIFDVSNVSAPIEIDMYSVEGEWSDTLVLTEHKAFLFEKSKDLLALPVSMYYYWGEYQMWQGLYVFNITLDSGLMLRGNVTHQGGDVYWNNDYWVNRALYIENVLYTLSNKRIKMNNLETLVEIKEIQIP